MTVYALVPVFNRLDMTKSVLDCLQTQRLGEPLKVIVIDDGSSDGTAEFLSIRHDIVTLHGDGNLWWGGAIESGLRHVLREGKPEDWVLLVNNDTHFHADFIQCLLNTARSHAPAAVGSVICDSSSPERLLSIGAMLDTSNMLTQDKLKQPRQRDMANGPHDVDALSGRGTLYPLQAFRDAGTMRPAWLPHYFADLELAVRVRKAGYRLLISEQAAVFSTDMYGSTWQPDGLMNRFIMVRSSSYLPALLAFWWTASSFSERLSLLPRLVRKFVRIAFHRIPEFHRSSQ